MDKYSDIFPTRTCLQLKIREVRQKMMAETKQQHTPSSAASTSASASTSSAPQQRSSNVPLIASGAVASISSAPVPVAVVSLDAQQQSRIFPSRAPVQQVASTSAKNRNAPPREALSTRVTRRAHSRSMTYSGFEGAAQQFL